MDFENFVISKKVVMLSFCGFTHSRVIVFPRKSDSGALKWPLCIDSFNPVVRMHSKVARSRWSASLRAMPISSTYSTYGGHWSALMTLSRYSRMKLEKADNGRLRP